MVCRILVFLYYTMPYYTISYDTIMYIYENHIIYHTNTIRILMVFYGLFEVPAEALFMWSFGPLFLGQLAAHWFAAPGSQLATLHTWNLKVDPQGRPTSPQEFFS